MDDASYRVCGLDSEVEIIVDRWGVPHIYASSRKDVFFAQGFNAARDRLFHLDLWHRRGLGRLSEIFGAAHVERDRAQRLFIYRGDMREEWDAYGPLVEPSTKSFVAGINAYVDWAIEDESRLPPEFTTWDYRPQRWDPSDIARIRTTGMYYNAEQELARFTTLSDFGAQVERLRHVTEPELPLELPRGIVPGSLGADVLHDYRLAFSPFELEEEHSLRPSDPGGSNSWAISAERTATGRPILASDPHRALSLPSLRYITHLIAPDLDVIGAGEPMLPGVSLGHNGRLAFGLTIFPIDQEDLYVYETNPGDPSCYRYDGGWERMTAVTEEIAIRDSDAVEVELSFTRHGPVIFRDVERHLAVAIRAVWLGPGMAPYLGSVESMAATTEDEFIAAINRWGAPGETYVYASSDGGIGRQAVGRVPIRSIGNGAMPTPGDGSHDWLGFRAPGTLPQERNPTRGWTASANQYNPPGDYPDAEQPISYDWSANTRYRRITEVLESNDRMSVADCVALQTDYTSLPAREIIAVLRSLPQVRECAVREWDLLEGWDTRLEPGSAPAALFEVWYRRHLHPALLRERLRQEEVPDARLELALKQILCDESITSDPRIDLRLLAEFEGASDERRQNLVQILGSTLKLAAEELTTRLGGDIEAWSWGRLHLAQLNHPLFPADSRRTPEWASLGPLPRGGSGDTVGATAYSDDFVQRSGASCRVAIDVGDWNNSVAMNSPGQSGDPRSSHYSDLFSPWASDGSFPLLYSRVAVEAHADIRLKLTPVFPRQTRSSVKARVSRLRFGRRPVTDAGLSSVVDDESVAVNETSAAAQSGEEPLPGRGLIFFIVALALFMASVDQTIVATALSTIQRDLNAGLEWSGWIITVYALGQILVMPLAGKLSDMYGRRRIFLIAAVLFTGASLCCGLADNIYLLVALRAVQAVGGGAFMPTASGIIADQFGRDRDRAIGMFTSIFPIGGIVGPILGGVFVNYSSWRTIFLVNVPIGIVLIVLGILFIPRGSPRPTRKVDIYGIVLLGLLILSTMFGITQLGTGTISVFSLQFIIPELVAVVMLVLFLTHTKRARAPFIPMHLLHGRGFGVMNVVNFLYGGATLGFGALIPLYAQERFSISVLEAGTLLTARAVGTICVAGLAVLALRRTGYRLPMIVGFVIIAAGFSAMAFEVDALTPYVWLSIAGGVTGIGMGMAVPASNNAIMQLAPDEVAAITGLRGMFRQSGAIMAISIATALVARSPNPGVTLGDTFLLFAVIMVCLIPLVFFVADHRGSW